MLQTRVGPSNPVLINVISEVGALQLHNIRAGVAVDLLYLLRNIQGQLPWHRLIPLPAEIPTVLTETAL